MRKLFALLFVIGLSGVGLAQLVDALDPSGPSQAKKVSQKTQCKPGKIVDQSWENTHHWIHDQGLLLDLNFGQRVEAEERIHAVAVLQNTIYNYTGVNSYEGPIVGHTLKFSYRFDIGRDKDVLTISHSNGKMEILTFRDGPDDKSTWTREER